MLAAKARGGSQYPHPMRVSALRGAWSWALAAAALASVGCGDDTANSSGTGGEGGASASGTTPAAPTGTEATSDASSGSTTSTTGSGEGGVGGTGSSTGGTGGGPTSCAGAPEGPTDVDHTLAWDGDDRRFRVHLPPGYPSAAPYPVVLMLHGYLEDGDEIENLSQMTPAADERGVVIVYADGLSLGSWNAGTCCGTSSSNDVDDVGFLGALLDQVIPEYCLDDRRVYAAGFSNGGMLSHRLACEMSDRVAAIGSTAGTLAIPECDPTRPVPVMHTHGTEDGVVQWEGGGFGDARSVEDTISTWVSLDGCTDDEPTTVYENGDATCVAWTSCAGGSEVRLCTIEGGGHQWPGGEAALGGGHLSEDLETSEELLEFLLGFSLPEGGPVACDDPDDPDCDGIEQALEDQIAVDYMPALSLHPDDDCPLGGILYRARPHPFDGALIFITYVVLYENDCGTGGHVGDDEVFGVTVDPTIPAPAGILSMKAIGHQGTPCEQVTDCGTCDGSNACDVMVTDGAMYPVIFHSEDKHAGYAHDSCDFFCDNGGCELAAAPAVMPMINVGEPNAQLVNDLTTDGFINEASGWTAQELYGFDPWAPGDFGSAGDVSDDLVDPAFIPDCF